MYQVRGPTFLLDFEFFRDMQSLSVALIHDDPFPWRQMIELKSHNARTTPSDWLNSNISEPHNLHTMLSTASAEKYSQ